MANRKKVLLIILDGWAEGKHSEQNAIFQANTEYIDSLYERYPHSVLKTYGNNVGLPEGQMGNSEVGHLNIGAGRVVFQELLRINNAIENGTLKSNKVLQAVFNYCKENDKRLHFIGLVSDGGVHSHIDHLQALITYSEEAGLKDVYIHAFTDGRDTDPKDGINYLGDLEKFLAGKRARMVSVIGRYYAMDRDRRWDRIKLAYDQLVHNRGEESDDLLESVQKSYNKGVTDEFILPVSLRSKEGEDFTIKEGDAVICFNFRTDRCRQITEVLTQTEMPDHDMKTIDLKYCTLTRYDSNFKDIDVLFDNENISNTLGEYLSNKGLKQLRIAETEKYPHVTFFFSGGREVPFPGEKRIMIPSPKVATYDLKPEMSAYEVTDSIIAELKTKEADFICLNFANADMVAHTGVFQAGIKAVETVDLCTEKVAETALENDYTVLITSDHGNADNMINTDGSPNTAHSKNPVPFFILDKEVKYETRDGKLADIAPTILHILDLEIPSEMNGKILIKENVVEE